MSIKFYENRRDENAMDKNKVAELFNSSEIDMLEYINQFIDCSELIDLNERVIENNESGEDEYHSGVRALLTQIGIRFNELGEAITLKYYEIEFAHRAEIEDENFINTPDRYSICILAEREPSYEEAENFCKEDMKNLGYDMVSDVLEISKEEAYNFFDMENAANFPIFK